MSGNWRILWLLAIFSFIALSKSDCQKCAISQHKTRDIRKYNLEWMSRRSGIPQAFTARLEEKKRKAREDSHDEFKNDFLALDVDSSNAEPPISDNNSTVPVEYAAKLMGATILPIGGIEVQFPFKPCKSYLQWDTVVHETFLSNNFDRPSTDTDDVQGLPVEILRMKFSTV